MDTFRSGRGCQNGSCYFHFLAHTAVLSSFLEARLVLLLEATRTLSLVRKGGVRIQTPGEEQEVCFRGGQSTGIGSRTSPRATSFPGGPRSGGGGIGINSPHLSRLVCLYYSVLHQTPGLLSCMNGIASLSFCESRWLRILLLSSALRHGHASCSRPSIASFLSFCVSRWLLFLLYSAVRHTHGPLTSIHWITVSSSRY